MTILAIDDADIPIAVRQELMAAVNGSRISYAWLCGVYRTGLAAGREAKIGATGTHPYGKLGPDDEGELAVAISADRRHGVVRFEFGKEIGWLALPAGHARQLAALLLEKAAVLERARS